MVVGRRRDPAACKADKGVEPVLIVRADDQQQRGGADRDAGEPERCTISAPPGLRLYDPLAIAVRARLGAGSPVQRWRQPGPPRSPTARRGSRLDLEHALCEPVDCRGVATRGYRNQRQALRGKQVCPLIRRQLMTDERLDLVPIEVLDPQMGRKSALEDVKQRPLEPVEECRPGQQDSRLRPLQLRRRGLRRFEEIFDLKIGETEHGCATRRVVA